MTLTEVAAVVRNEGEGNGDETRGRHIPFARHTPSNPCIEREVRTGTGNDEGKPREDKDNVRAGVEGRGVKANRQEKSQGEGYTAEGRHSGPETHEDTEPNGDFTNRNYRAYE